MQLGKRLGTQVGTRRKEQVHKLPRLDIFQYLDFRSYLRDGLQVRCFQILNNPDPLLSSDYTYPPHVPNYYELAS